jgi:hypothetical protein
MKTKINTKRCRGWLNESEVKFPPISPCPLHVNPLIGKSLCSDWLKHGTLWRVNCVHFLNTGVLRMNWIAWGLRSQPGSYGNENELSTYRWEPINGRNNNTEMEDIDNMDQSFLPQFSPLIKHHSLSIFASSRFISSLFFYPSFFFSLCFPSS